MFMSTGLKVSSLACKCVNFTDQNIIQRGKDHMELNSKCLEMQKWNIPTDRVQRVDGKNRVICLVIMFPPWVMVIKMSKMAHFLYLLLMPAKVSQRLDKIFTCIWKILFRSPRKCYGLLDSELPLARYQPLKRQSFIIFFADSVVFLYFYLRYFTNGNSKTYEPYDFLKELKKIF